MPGIPDTRASLIVRLAEPRDEQAWHEFVEIYEPLIHRVASRAGLQPTDAAELTQEVLLAVSRSVARWDPAQDRGRFRGWLFRIARNLLINWLHQQRRRPQAIGNTDFMRLLQNQADPVARESSFFDLEYRRRVFRWAADRVRDQVEPHTWQAFWLTAVQTRQPDEVAELLGMKRGAVYVARSRVLAKLKSEVEQFDQQMDRNSKEKTQ